MRDPVTRYLERRADLDTRPLEGDPGEGVGCVVVIPALAERDTLPKTLESLARNPEVELRRTLVIVVVNQRDAEDVPPETLENNTATLAWLRDEARGACPELRLAWVDAARPGRELRAKEGVGAARKIGLDWGLAMLLRNEAVEHGTLVNLDADTLVDSGYLTALRGHFSNPAAWAGVADFAHQTGGTREQQEAILQYELYLRYHVLGLMHAGSPYAFHTIGSTMACTAQAYAAVGGMNRRQAGEDFYFLQQLAKTGRVDSIEGAVVHPSSRASWRVPFGTGRAMGLQRDRPADPFTVTVPESYDVLGDWLAIVRDHVQEDAASILERARNRDAGLSEYLESTAFETTWVRLAGNAPNPASMLKRFYEWFDGLKSLRLLHHLRDRGTPDLPLARGIRALEAWYDEKLLPFPDGDPDSASLDRVRALEKRARLLPRAASL